jgi:hypothetical protein
MLSLACHFTSTNGETTSDELLHREKKIVPQITIEIGCIDGVTQKWITLPLTTVVRLAT